MKKSVMVFGLILITGVTVLGEVHTGHVKGDVTVWYKDGEDNKEVTKEGCVKSDYEECECDGPLEGEEVSSENDCVHLSIHTGQVRPSSILKTGFLNLIATDPTPMLYSPQMLKVVTTYGMVEMYNKTAGDVYRTIHIMDPDGREMRFDFEEDESVASLSQIAPFFDEMLMMVDAEGWAVTEYPAYYDLYSGGGELYRFAATTNTGRFGQLVMVKTAQGRTEWVTDAEMDIVKTPEGVLRQVKSASRLLDLVVESEWTYRVDIYHTDDISGADSNGVYGVDASAEPLRQVKLTNPQTNSLDHFHVIDRVGSTVNTSLFEYVFGEWILTKGNIKESKVENWNDARDMFLVTHELSDIHGLTEKQQREYNKFPWGFERVRKTEGFNGLEETTDYTYYEDESETGRYGNRKSKISTDGSWTLYDYNSAGRKSLEITPWKDATTNAAANEAKAVYYDYEPEDTNDVFRFNDQRPRTVTEKILGQTVKKTFHAYPTNAAGETLEIKEICLRPDAAYGDADNLRTEKIYFAPSAAAHLIGRLKTVEYPDGRLETWNYESGNIDTNNIFTPDAQGNAWRKTLTHGTTNSPAGIAGKTLREITVQNRYSSEVLKETQVYTGGETYEQIAATEKTFNLFGQAIETRHSDGRIREDNWTGCCGKDGETDEQGIDTAYTYDELGRLETSTKFTTTNTGGVATTYTLDAIGRRLTETLSAPGISPLTTTHIYDELGRKTKTTDPRGLVTTNQYSNGGRYIIKTLPGGAVQTTERYADRKTKKIIGTAVVDRHFDYGTETNGCTWTTTYTGPAGLFSPQWEKTVTDMAGRTIRTEKPAFGGGVLVTENTYGSCCGLLISQRTLCGSATLRETLYSYDSLGNRILIALDLDGSGDLTLTADRITKTETSYQSISNEMWKVTESRICPEAGSTNTLVTSVRKTRLTGLGSTSDLGLLISETVSIDLLENETVSRTYIDRAEKTVTQINDIPTSTQDVVQVSINGLLQSAKSAQSAETLFSYDSLERRTGTTDPRTGTAIVHYNPIGQIDWQEDTASNRTTFAYDSGTGRKTAQTNALGSSTLYTYNPRGQVTEVGGSSQYPVEYGYDDLGRMTDLYTLRGATNGWDRTQWLYDDGTGLMTNKLYADGNGPTYTYTPGGKLQTRTWARTAGVSPALPLTTTYSYDSAGSLTNTVYTDDTPSVSLEYNRLGQKTQVIDASGTNTFTYNSLLQLIGEANVGHASSLSRLHDSFGRSAGITHNSDYAVSYAFDDIGRFSSVSSSVASVTSMFDYSYLEDSSLISGYTSTAGVSPALSVSYDFEPNRNAKTTVLNQFGTNLVSSFDYTYDPLMRRTQRTDVSAQGSEVSTNDFSYNARSELTSALMGTNDFDYAYDNIGNRNQTTENGGQTTDYLSSELNQYLSVTSVNSVVTFQYDSDGNLTNDAVNAYAWNGENRLIKVTPINPTTNNHQLIFSYDYMGRRTSKDVYEWDSSQSQWSNAKSLSFVYDGWNLISGICSPTSGSSSTNCFIWGLDLSQSLQGAGGVGGLLAVVEGRESSPSEPYFPAFDANGNVTDYVSTNGTVVAHYEYDPYGGLISSIGTMANDFVFRFSTKYLDAETGFSYYGYRYYSPEVGRWLNRDPKSEEGGLHLYAFLGNSPVILWDVNGLEAGCTTISYTFSYQLAQKSFPTPIPFLFVGVSGDIDISVSGESCKKCCPDGSEQDVLTIKAQVSGSATLSATAGIDGAFSFPGVGSVEYWAGVRLSGGGSVSGSGSFENTCEGDIAGSGTGTFSGNAGVDVGGSASFRIGKFGGGETGLTGGGSSTVDFPFAFTCDETDCSITSIGSASVDASLHVSACLVGYCFKKEF